MQPAVFNCHWARARGPCGEAPPQVCSVVFFPIYSTGKMEQDCSTQLCVWEKGQQSTALLLMLSPCKMSPGNITSGGSILCSYSKTSTYVPARRCKSARTRKKKWLRDVCVREGDKSFSCLNPRWFFFKEKKSQLLFSFSCLFSLDRVIFLHQFSSFTGPLFFLFGTTRRGRKESMPEEMEEKWISTTWKSI